MKKFPKKYVIILVVLCFLTFTIFFIIDKEPELKELFHSYNLLPKPEPFTELYIQDHLLLPQFLAADQVATASFTIRNVEHKPVKYDYIVTETTGDQKEVIASGTARLAHNQSVSKAFRFSVATIEPKTKIEIALPEKQQSIHFWINNN